MVVDAEWNDSTQSVEALLYLPDNYINFIKNENALGRDVKYSVEYSWREENYDETDGSVEFHGLVFHKIAILLPEHMPEGFAAGDMSTTSTLAEDYFNKRGLMEMAEVKEEKKEEVVKKDKVSISVEEGLLYAIDTLKKEKETLLNEKKDLTEKLSVESKKATDLSTEKQTIEKKLSEVSKEKDDNVTAVTKLQETVSKFDNEKLRAIEQAKLEAKNEIIERVSSVLPTSTVTNAPVMYRALAGDVKKALSID
jgi:hypothetical protein